jgi:hypothetical protein
MFNFAIDLTGFAAIIWLGSALGSRSIGLVAGLAYLWAPPEILMAPYAHKEGLVAALAVASAAAAIGKRPAMLGVLSALLALTQPALIPLSAMFACAFLPPASWPIFVSVGVIAMLPWWIRNWLLFHSFVPHTTSSGLSLWVAAFGNGNNWTRYPPSILHGSELDVNRNGGAMAIQYISSHPSQWLAKCMMKTLRALAQWPFTALLLLTPFVLGKISILCWLCLLQLFAFQAWFEMGQRHLFYMLPFLLLLGSSAARRAHQ